MLSIISRLYGGSPNTGYHRSRHKHELSLHFEIRFGNYTCGPMHAKGIKADSVKINVEHAGLDCVGNCPATDSVPSRWKACAI